MLVVLCLAMAQIIMGLDGLPAHLTVSANNFREDADK